MGPIVACLTTIPSRVRFLRGTIESLHNQQTYPIDRIFLFLPKWSSKEQCTYPPLPFERDRFPRLSVIECTTDYGPITKLVPLLERDSVCASSLPDSTMILICDDDRLYSIDTVETLVVGWHRLTHAHGAVRVGAIGCSGILASSSVSAWTSVRQPSRDTAVDILEGTYGVLHSLGTLRQIGHEKLSDFAPCPQARYCDDVWTSALLHEHFGSNPCPPLWVVPMLSTRAGNCHRYNAATNVSPLSKNAIGPSEVSSIGSVLSEGRAWLRNWHVVQSLRKQTRFALRTPIPSHSYSPTGVLFPSVGASLVAWPLLLLFLLLLLWCSGHWIRWVLTVLFLLVIGILYLWLSMKGFFTFHPG